MGWPGVSGFDRELQSASGLTYGTPLGTGVLHLKGRLHAEWETIHHIPTPSTTVLNYHGHQKWQKSTMCCKWILDWNAQTMSNYLALGYFWIKGVLTIAGWVFPLFSLSWVFSYTKTVSFIGSLSVGRWLYSLLWEKGSWTPVMSPASYLIANKGFG